MKDDRMRWKQIVVCRRLRDAMVDYLDITPNFFDTLVCPRLRQTHVKCASSIIRPPFNWHGPTS